MRAAITAGALLALAISNLTLTTAAHAAASDYVLTPIVEEGEREIDFKAGFARARDGTRTGQQSLGFGWGVNSVWSTELYAKWHQEPGATSGFDAWEWENRFQLTETGKYPVDIGLLLEIERPKDRSEGYEYRWGPLFQADLNPLVDGLQANVNLLWQKHVRVVGGEPARLFTQWQLKMRWRPELEYGIQGFGDLGPWRGSAAGTERPQNAGPAIFGRVKLSQRQTLKYNAGLLFGLNHDAPRQTLRMQAEVEF